MDIVQSRPLAVQLFLRNVRAQYRQALLGVAWAILPALVSTAVFVVVDAPQILGLGDTPIAYPVYVLCGTILWQCFVEAINMPFRQFLAAVSMLDKYRFPREALLLSGIAELLLNLAVRLSILVPCLIYYGIKLTFCAFFAPLGILAIIGLGMAIGVVLAPIGLLYRDVERGLGIMISAGFALTPIVYPISNSSVAKLMQYNPLSPLLVTTRDWMTGQPAVHLESFAFISLVTVILLSVGWITFRVSIPHIIQRISA